MFKFLAQIKALYKCNLKLESAIFEVSMHIQNSSNNNNDNRSHCRRYIVALISRGLPPALAESMAFEIFGNPLQGGRENG